MRILRASLLLAAVALLPGCVVAADSGYGYYGGGYYAPRPYYGPVYRPAPPPRAYYYGRPRYYYR